MGSALTMVKKCTTDGQLRLANGSLVPVVIGACDKHREIPLNQNMPCHYRTNWQSDSEGVERHWMQQCSC